MVRLAAGQVNDLLAQFLACVHVRIIRLRMLEFFLAVSHSASPCPSLPRDCLGLNCDSGKDADREARDEKIHTCEPTEVRLIKAMARAGVTWSKIKEIIGRGNGALEKALKSKARSPAHAKAVGRPIAITSRVYKRLEKVMEKMQVEAKGVKEVTVTMIKIKSRYPLCARGLLTLVDFLHAIFFMRRRRSVVKQYISEAVKNSLSSSLLLFLDTHTHTHRRH